MRPPRDRDVHAPAQADHAVVLAIAEGVANGVLHAGLGVGVGLAESGADAPVLKLPAAYGTASVTGSSISSLCGMTSMSQKPRP